MCKKEETKLLSDIHFYLNQYVCHLSHESSDGIVSSRSAVQARLSFVSHSWHVCLTCFQVSKEADSNFTWNLFQSLTIHFVRQYFFVSKSEFGSLQFKYQQYFLTSRVRAQKTNWFQHFPFAYLKGIEDVTQHSYMQPSTCGFPHVMYMSALIMVIYKIKCDSLDNTGCSRGNVRYERFYYALLEHQLESRQDMWKLLKLESWVPRFGWLT